jgi:release factor glutamine methyltransferase
LSHRRRQQAPATNQPARYRPALSAAQQRTLRKWHDDSHQRILATLPLQQSVLGLEFVVGQDVYPPGNEDFYQFVRAHVNPNDRVLDMGTGSGAVALVAAQGSAHVIAVDINPSAIACAHANAVRNRLQSLITFRHSDVFAAVPESFDLIAFNPPYRWFAPRSLLEMATADEGYRALSAFMAQAKDHLLPHGRILMGFGSSGDIDYLHALIEGHGFHKEVTPAGTQKRNGMTVNYYHFRLTA